MKTNKKPVQLTPALLRSIIEEEVGKFGDMEDVEDRKAKEVDADEYGADANAELHIDNVKSRKIKEAKLDKHIDFMKALKIEEARLVRRHAKVRATLHKAAQALVGKI